MRVSTLRRHRTPTVIACLALAGAMLGTSGTSLRSSAVQAEPALHQLRRTPVLDKLTITGAAVPDVRAYAVLFRILADTPDRPNTEASRAYMQYMGLGRGCQSCGDQSANQRDISTVIADMDQKNDQELDQFAAFLANANARLSSIDSKARSIRRSDTSPFGVQTLRGLQVERDLMVRQLIDEMPLRLGANAANRIRGFVNDRMKPRIKVYVD